MKFRWILFFSFLLFPATVLLCQEEDPCIQVMDSRSEKQFKKARDLQKKGKKEEANEIYVEILDEHPEYLEVNYYYALGYYLPIEMKGFIIENPRNARRALDAFNRIYDICPFYKFHHNLYAARIAYFMENFPEAVKFAKIMVENPDMVKNMDHLEEAETIIKKSGFYARILANPVPFDPKPVEGISTQYDEYLATLSPDGEQFYFTRRQPYRNPSSYFSSAPEDREFFSISRKKPSGKFPQGEPLPYPFNQSTNEGSPAINLTNDLLIFSRMTPATINGQSYPNYDLYYSEYIDGEWTVPQSLGPHINREDSWESQPSLSSDGKILFFASDRPGGYGGSDIWFSEKGPDGVWQTPVNPGPKINTEGNERSPFLHTDSKTLYFSSSGHQGLGGLDVFYSRYDSEKGWQTPVNIGHPINSENDEVDFFVSLDGNTAYFSSNNIESEDWNIYQFDLYEEARPSHMILMKGVAVSEEGDLSGTVVEIRDTASNILASTEVDERTGKYALAIETEKEKPVELIINVKKEGHAFDTKLVKTDQIVNNVVETEAEIKKIEVGKTYHLHDIYFGTNLYSLTNESKHIIDLFVEFLNENPSVKAEIQGHTDDIGDDQANQLLSERRAKSVYDYIISRRIDPARLRYKGYGENLPIAPNTTPEGRAKNRRTVFLIFDK